MTDAADIVESDERFTILFDTREQTPWKFMKTKFCAGTYERKLDQGDYTIEGGESLVVVERKGTIAELATNITDKRFFRELERLRDTVRFPFVVLEFTLGDVFTFPRSSSIPRNRWKYLRVTGDFMLKRICELELQYGVRFVFAGSKGKEFSLSLFKRCNHFLKKGTFPDVELLPPPKPPKKAKP